MAIEGNDWWAIAGAAAGGLVVGAVGAKFLKRPEPIFTGLSRWYKESESSIAGMPLVNRAVATIWQSGSDYFVRVYSFSEPKGSEVGDERALMTFVGHGRQYDIEDGPFSGIEHAIEAAEEVMKDSSSVPLRQWSDVMG